MGEPLKLNLGAGAFPLDGYVNIDRKDGGEVFPLHHRTVGGFSDGSADEVRASHVLEHFSHREVPHVLKEWVRVLRPGGVLKLAVPDFDKAVSMYLDGSDPKVEGYIFGGHADEDDKHGSLFNKQKLHDLMLAVGLVGIREWESEIKDCAALPVSLNLMGFKPRKTTATLEDVTAVLSMPRYAFTQNVVCLLEAQHKLRLKARVRTGVFWGQSLTRAITESLAADAPKYVLTIDNDTVFKPDQVRELHRLLEDNPGVDAVCGTQIGRDRDTPLLTIRKDADTNVTQVVKEDYTASELLPIATGHFGLTMIRASAFDKLDKPWFLHHPDPQGGWGEGRVDEDIHFWRNFEKNGLKLCQANFVRLGHWQDVVTLPDDNLRPVHVYAPAFRDGDLPDNVKW